MDRDFIINHVLLPAIKELYEKDYGSIRIGVSERNICARLAHYMENIVKTSEENCENNSFEIHADVEYNRIGCGDVKRIVVDSETDRKKAITSDLLLHVRGGRNFLAVEMKKTSLKGKAQEDRRRLQLMVSPRKRDDDLTCVRDTKVGAMIIYSEKQAEIEIYEYVSLDNEAKKTFCFIMHFEDGNCCGIDVN